MNQPANTLRIVKEGSKEANRYRETIRKTNPVGDFERAFGSFGRALDNFMPTFIKVAREIAKTTQKYKDESLDDYQIRRWLSQVPHGGMVGDKAVLVVYNEEHPSQSYLIVEDTKNL